MITSKKLRITLMLSLIGMAPVAQAGSTGFGPQGPHNDTQDQPGFTPAKWEEVIEKISREQNRGLAADAPYPKWDERRVASEQQKIDRDLADPESSFTDKMIARARVVGNLHKVVAGANAFLGLTKLFGDLADAGKLEPQRAADMKRGWIRAFDDQVNGLARGLLGVGSNALVVLQAAATTASAGSVPDGITNYKAGDYALAGTAAAAVLVQLIHFVYDAFTLGKVRLNERARTDYARFLRGASESDMSQLASKRSTLKTTAMLHFILTLIQSAAVYKMGASLESGNLHTDPVPGTTPAGATPAKPGAGRAAAWAAALSSIAKSLVAMYGRSTFSGQLTAGARKGKKLRAAAARHRRQQARLIAAQAGA